MGRQSYIYCTFSFEPEECGYDNSPFPQYKFWELIRKDQHEVLITPTRHTIKDFDYHSAPWGIEYLSTYAIEELDRIFDFIEEHGDEFRRKGC